MERNCLVIENFENERLALVIDQITNPELEIVITHIKKKDICLVYENLNLCDPVSVPGKISMVLYNRFKKLHGSQQKGLAFITPFLPDQDLLNLEAFIIEVAHYNRFDPHFIDWIEQSNDFSNSNTN